VNRFGLWNIMDTYGIMIIIPGLSQETLREIFGWGIWLVVEPYPSEK
jgi:hypothetical protein